MEFGQFHKIWLDNVFLCNLVELTLGFAVLEYLDNLIFEPGDGVFEDGPVACLSITTIDTPFSSVRMIMDWALFSSLKALDSCMDILGLGLYLLWNLLVSAHNLQWNCGETLAHLLHCCYIFLFRGSV